MNKQVTRLALAGTTALALLLAGCGGNGMQYDPNNPYGSDPYGSGGGYGSDPYGSDPYGSDPYGSGGGYGSDPYGGSGGYGSTPGYGTTPGYGSTPGYGTTPTPGYGMGGQLTLGRIDKKKSGLLLWKKTEVSGQVTNSTQGPLSGELQISFMKGGKVVETQYEFVTDLAPGQSHTFTLKSKKSADDAEVTVTTQEPVNFGGSGGYGGGYGSTPGYGTQPGYGSGGYGGGTGSGGYGY